MGLIRRLASIFASTEKPIEVDTLVGPQSDLPPFQRIGLEREAEAVKANAIAAIWIWRGGSTGCYVREHEQRDGQVFLIRGSWAEVKGLLSPADGYTDTIDKPLEREGCRCSFDYKFALRSVPERVLSPQGKAAARN